MAAAKGQRGGGRKPVDSKTRARVRKLGREGLSRNAIAKAVGLSTSTVSRICSEARPPITFDRAATKAAVEAVQWDARAARSSLAQAVIHDAETVRAALFKTMTRVHYSVTDGRVEYEGDPTPSEMRDLATTMGILIDKHLVLVRHDSDDRELPAVDAWLGAMLQRSAS